MTITHAFVSSKADGGDATLVRPSNWNAAHIITETGGQALTIGAISDGQVLARSGTVIIGQAASSNSGPTFPGGIPMTSVKYIAAYNMSVSTGNTDLYTVPANKRALVQQMYLQNNSGVGNIVWFPQVKISGTYYRLNNNATSTNGNNQTSIIGYIAEAAEVVSVNTTTNNSGAVSTQIIEYDNTVAVFTAKLTSFSAGDNTVYTVTAGKSAIILPQSLITAISGNLLYVNSSGLGRTIFWKLTPSGGSATQVTASASPGDGTRSSATVNLTLSAGDVLSLNTDANTATQMAWVNTMEI